MPLPSPILFPSPTLFPGHGLEDYEVPNGVETIYRARAAHILGIEAGALFGSYSDWVYAPHISWTSRAYWLKHPTKPSMNVAVELQSPASDGLGRDSRQSVMQPLGSDDAVVISDTRAPETGNLIVNTRSEVERLAVEDLAKEEVPVLLQAQPSDNWHDRWIVLGSQTSQRAPVDKGFIPYGTIAFGWTEVKIPEGALVEF